MADINALSKILKSAGYDSQKIAGHTITIFTPEKSRPERKALLQKLAKSIHGARWIQTRDEYGAVSYQDLMVVHKPGGGADGKSAPGASLEMLDARVFSGKAKPGFFSYHGKKVPVMTFTSAKQIEESIIEGCRKSPQLGPAVADVFESFFGDPNPGLTWTSGIDIKVRKKLGVYVGEVLVGWVFLSKRTKYHFPGVSLPGADKAVAFHMPTDPAFRGVDSFVELKDKSYYAMSSKYGVGAKASLFGNLMEQGKELLSEGVLPNSAFKNLMTAAKPFTDKQSRSIVYTFGARNLLKLSPAQLNPHDLEIGIQQIIRNVPGRQKTMLHSAAVKMYQDPSLKKYTAKINAQIQKTLPTGITALFNQMIAAILNEDAASIKTVRQILAGKDYWQANLNDREWEKDDGYLKYNLLHTKAAKINFIGSKSPIGDPTAKQGWVNYELFA